MAASAMSADTKNHLPIQPTPPLSDEAALALGYIAAIDRNASDEARAAEEGEVARFAVDITNVDEALGVYDALLRRAADPNAIREHIRKARERFGLPSDQPQPEDEALAREWYQGIGQRVQLYGFAEVAPAFSDQVADGTRTKPFRFNITPEDSELRPDEERELTETEGLRELHGFLTRFLRETDRSSGSFYNAEMASKARSILESLTFIGEKEYQIGCQGLGAYWKAYLDADPQRQICVLTPISDGEKYQKLKSDAYLRDRILQTFTDEELEQYSGRIVSQIEDISVKPENARIILLDDWSISGQQLQRAYAELAGRPRFLNYVRGGSVEINLITASKERLRKGLPVTAEAISSRNLTVRSYYMSNEAVDAEYNVHVTGLHSSSNFDFSKPINSGMVGTLRNLGRLRNSQPLVALANVIRPYEDESLHIEITPDLLRRVEGSEQ